LAVLEASKEVAGPSLACDGCVFWPCLFRRSFMTGVSRALFVPLAPSCRTGDGGLPTCCRVPLVPVLSDVGTPARSMHPKQKTTHSLLKRFARKIRPKPCIDWSGYVGSRLSAYGGGCPFWRWFWLRPPIWAERFSPRRFSFPDSLLLRFRRADSGRGSRPRNGLRLDVLRSDSRCLPARENGQCPP